MSEMLKSAGAARKQSIQLSNVPYGKDLSVELLEFAKSMETLFIKIQSSLESSDEKKLRDLVETAVLKEKEGEKAKAWPSLCNFIFQRKASYIYIITIYLFSYDMYINHQMQS